MSKERQLELAIEGSSHVRFPAMEYQKLVKDSNKLRKSIPVLLRDAYFNRLPTKVLWGLEDLRQIISELNRIGNNINQIARKVNVSVMCGWHPVLEEAQADFIKLKDSMYLGYNHK